MSVLTNREIKKLFILMSLAFIGLICLLQGYLVIWSGAFQIAPFLFSVAAALCVMGSCFLYFNRQREAMENAISAINRFLSGDSAARIECDSEGSLYKLFHSINTLATTLDAHAVKEQEGKVFLKDTISDISHQLKTPLAALAIYNSLLQDELENKEAILEFAKKSERELERIEGLVQDLLKITKLDAGAILMDKHPENLAKIMNDVRLRFETRAEMERKTISYSGDCDIELLCDRRWMIEAVSNLVKNALDHTKGESHIAVEWRQLAFVIQIIVKDDGSGIHPEDIHHIFKRFYRSRFSKDIQGVGLGLSMAKAIATAHDGTISADSELGKGAVFTMNFQRLTKV